MLINLLWFFESSTFPSTYLIVYFVCNSVISHRNFPGRTWTLGSQGLCAALILNLSQVSGIRHSKTLVNWFPLALISLANPFHFHLTNIYFAPAKGHIRETSKQLWMKGWPLPSWNFHLERDTNIVQVIVTEIVHSSECSMRAGACLSPKLYSFILYDWINDWTAGFTSTLTD